MNDLDANRVVFVALISTIGVRKMLHTLHYGRCNIFGCLIEVKSSLAFSKYEQLELKESSHCLENLILALVLVQIRASPIHIPRVSLEIKFEISLGFDFIQFLCIFKLFSDIFSCLNYSVSFYFSLSFLYAVFACRQYSKHS